MIRTSARLLCLLALGLCTIVPVQAQLPRSVAADAGRATEVGPEGAAALVRVLQHYHAAGDGEGGFAWWQRLPFAVRAQQTQRAEVRLWRHRVEFLRDAQRGDAKACAASGAALLAMPLPATDRERERERLRACLNG